MFTARFYSDTSLSIFLDHCDALDQAVAGVNNRTCLARLPNDCPDEILEAARDLGADVKRERDEPARTAA